MKKLVTSYTFDASAQTIVSADFTSLEKIQLITNVTDQLIIYNFADSAKGGTLAGTTLTLEYDTTAMDDADKLQIFVEDGAAVQAVSASSLPLPTGASTAANQTTGNTALAAIQTAVEILDNVISGAEAQVDVVGALPAGTNNIGDVDVATLPVAFNTGTRSATTQRVTIATDDLVPVSMATNTPVGNVAHDAADSGNPIKLGGKARTTNPTPVADADRVDATFDDLGRQVMVMNQVRDLCADQHTTITSSTSATTIVTAAASTFHDLVSLSLANTSATGTEVQLLDDDGTTVRWAGFVPATDMRGIVFQVPLKQTTVNHTWKFKTVTSVASVKVTAQFVKNV